MNEEELIKKIEEEARQYFTKSLPSHDWSHVERVYKLCIKIGEKENTNLFILRLSSLLYDIGREEEMESNGKKDHAEISKNLSYKILKKYNIPDEDKEHILECIETHRFRDNKTPKTIEAKILFDADKIDSISAVGIGRSYAWCGEKNLKLYSEKNYLGNGYEKEHSPVTEFLFKLSKVKDRLFTRTGKQIAEERHNFMINFFNQLKKEVED